MGATAVKNPNEAIGRAPEQLTLEERIALAGKFAAFEIYTPDSLPLRRIEAIGEMFNVFNAKNPSLALTQSRMTVVNSVLVPNPSFMQPTAYAGDVGQPEQRIGQIGFRFTF